MHLQIATAKGKRYVRIVESFRRPSDGMPTKRIVANLGQLSEDEIANFRTALEASRKGQRVIVARRHATTAPQKPSQNLQYLDAAVALELWRQWRLDGLLEELLESRKAAEVVTALVVQRCIQPGSKLSAARWFPRTALPELLGFAPSAFNNSRVHRALAALDKATGKLMQRLPHAYMERGGEFVTLFVDVTDTWFVGSGPDAAERGKTKEGHIRKKIGIVLLCDQRGYPLRWEVVAGNRADCHNINDMYQQAGRLSWARRTTVVCDRAMGATAEIRKLMDSKIRFLTAMRRTEFASYAREIPWKPFLELEPAIGQDAEAFHQKVRAVADTTNMTRVGDDLYVLDLEVVQPSVEPQRVARRATATAGAGRDTTQEALGLGQQILGAVETGAAVSQAAAARQLGLSGALGKKYTGLVRRLADDIVSDIESRGSGGLSLAVLTQLCRIADADEQRQAYRDERQRRAHRPNRRKAVSPVPAGEPVEPLRVRVVAYFNPEIFANQRRFAQERLTKVQEHVADVNSRAHNYRTAEDLEAVVTRRLRKLSLLDAYDVKGRRSAAGAMTVSAILKQNEWARRRRYDGFSVLVAHPDVRGSAIEIARLYRSKDVIEKDFQVIKSAVEIRPIRHFTDAKVRAHVTICMLALLLERTLHNQLGKSSSAGRALETLSACRLNRFQADDQAQPLYLLTQSDADQEKLLGKLGLLHLIDDLAVADAITPR